MVRTIRNALSFLGRDIDSIHHAAYILAGATFLGQILGLFRDRLLAGLFGASATLDVYYSAFKVQDTIFIVVGSLLSLSVLIPLLSEALEKGGSEKARAMLGSLLSVAFFAAAAIAAAAALAAPFLAGLFFPGITGVSQHTLVVLMRLLLLSPFFFFLSGALSSVLQIHGRFYITSATPLLYNLGIIFGIIFLRPQFGIYGVGAGVLIGAALNALVQIPFVASLNLLPRLTFKIDWPLIKEAISLSAQRGLALGIQYLTVFFLTGIATTIAVGAVSVMTFAQNLEGVPLGLIGMSYSIAAFPTLSRFFALGDKAAFGEKLSIAIRHIIFWSLPAAALFIVLRAHIVRAVLGSGAFNWENTRLTAACLSIFVMSVVFQGLVLLLMRAHYAAGRNRDVLLASTYGAIISVAVAFAGLYVFNNFEFFRFFLEGLLRIEDVSGTSVIMLPIAFLIGNIVSTAYLFYTAKNKISITLAGWKETAFHSFAAAALAAFVAYQFLDYFGSIFGTDKFISILTSGMAAGLLGTAAGAVLLYMIGNSEFKEIMQAIKSRFSKEEMIAPQNI